MVMQGDSNEMCRLITCPGCLEEMARAELVGRKCPLCGYTLSEEELREESVYREGDEELTWMLTQNLQRLILEWLSELGAAPMTAYRIAYRVCSLEVLPEVSDDRTVFSFPVRMTPEEAGMEKVCKSCGRSFVSGGRKFVSGDLYEPETESAFYCDCCRDLVRRD